MSLEHPLRLAVGSHQAGSGRGCAMNLISWESGDTTITDLPECSDPFLARVVQRVNDTLCTHRDGDLLCPACSQVVLRLAHMTVGTGGCDPDMKVTVRVAAEEAQRVAHMNQDPRVQAAIDAALAWCDAPHAAARAAAYAAARAAYAAADAADAARAARAADAAAYAAAYAADAAAYAAARAARAAADAAVGAERVITRWTTLAGITPAEPSTERVAAAIEQMLVIDEVAS